MPNKKRQSVRKLPPSDARTRRTTNAVAFALFQLIQEGDGRFEDITVREIVERAGVGRTAFYAHFRSKEDVLHSTYETVFSSLKLDFDENAGAERRLFPVTEFFEHVARSKPVMSAFRKAGIVDDMKSHIAGYAGSIIEGRMMTLNLEPAVPPKLAARMLAASLVESIDWVVDHDSVSPGEIDAAFHGMATTLLRHRTEGFNQRHR